ncbi:hypothetical protein V8E55_006813 [Tylopilus felleus]
MVRSRPPVNSSAGEGEALFSATSLRMTPTYGLYFHGSHSSLDGCPTLLALGLMFEWMADDSLSTPINLEFGLESRNLPPDPVSVSGGNGAVHPCKYNLFVLVAVQDSSCSSHDRFSSTTSSSVRGYGHGILVSKLTSLAEIAGPAQSGDLPSGSLTGMRRLTVCLEAAIHIFTMQDIDNSSLSITQYDNRSLRSATA